MLGKLFMHAADSNTALIKFSGRHTVHIVLDGPIFAIPVIQRVYSPPLHLRPIIIHTACATSRDGFDINLTSFCKVKIHSCLAVPAAKRTSTELEKGLSAIRLAAQSFSGRNSYGIEQTIQYTIARHQRAVIAVLTTEEIYRNRAVFSQLVLDECHDDMRKMGLTLQTYSFVEMT